MFGISKIEDSGEYVEITFTNGQTIAVSYDTQGEHDMVRIVEVLGAQLKDTN